MSYQPKPIDTSGVRLDRKLASLTEFLAANTHDVWASGRIGQGWTYGPVREDIAKKHPDLVPYEQLTEVEKQYDRDTALQTLKVIISRGYQIIPPPEDKDSVRASEWKSFSQADLMQMGVAQILSLWKALDAESEPAPAEVYHAIAERALNLGEPLLAFDVLKTALKQYPAHVKLRQKRGVALSRGGVAGEAVRRLQELRSEGHDDEETLGNLASAVKTRWEVAVDPAERETLLELAFTNYESAYRHAKGGYWTGINAATLAVCLGRQDRAESIAGEIETMCTQIIETADEDQSYWELATLGEAALVRRDFAAAESWYRRAADVARGAYGLIASTRQNATHLLRHFNANPSLLDRWLPMPRVVVFTGHMIDRADRSAPRFPAQLEGAIAGEIRRRVEALDVRFGYASAACGADILFHEAVAERGGEVNIVLPYELERFMRDSVCLERGSSWEARLRKLLARTQTRLIVASQSDLQDLGVANEYANQFTFGLAGIRAFQMRTQLAALAVWDGQPGDGAGGTSSAIARWRACGIEPTIIDVRDVMRRELPDVAKRLDAAPPVTQGPVDTVAGGAGITGHMMALLFADVVGFSRLSEDEIPRFVEHFLKPVARLCECGPAPVHRNTWGDGLYFVFKDVNEAGRFALELRDLVVKTDWLALGFRAPLSLRTGLHVGPVYKTRNPVTDREEYIGTHVSRAARIEPITPRGEVYASEVFAAIAFTERVDAFTCDYVGQIGLAKEYGTYPTYHVRRR